MGNPLSDLQARLKTQSCEIIYALQDYVLLQYSYLVVDHTRHPGRQGVPPGNLLAGQGPREHRNHGAVLFVEHPVGKAGRGPDRVPNTG